MQGVYYACKCILGYFCRFCRQQLKQIYQFCLPRRSVNEAGSKGFMVTINADAHPGLHRYSLELAKYPELSEEQYNSVLSDLKQPEGSVLYQNARETLICSHLAMILGMAKDTYRRYYGLSMEDYVGLGNMAMVTKFNRFKVGQKVPFAAYMKKVIERYILANVKKHVVWDRAEDVDIELVGISDSFADDRNYDFLHRAIGELSELEQKILHYTFFDDFEPDDREIARKLRISKNYLAETRQKIFEKLRGKLQRRYLPVPDRRYIVEPRTQEELS